MLGEGGRQGAPRARGYREDACARRATGGLCTAFAPLRPTQGVRRAGRSASVAREAACAIIVARAATAPCQSRCGSFVIVTSTLTRERAERTHDYARRGARRFAQLPDESQVLRATPRMSSRVFC